MPDRTKSRRRARAALALGATLLGAAGVLAAPASAQAAPAAPFTNCPVADASVSTCIASVGLSGSFTIGSITVDLPAGTTLQGGLAFGADGTTYVPATDGKTLVVPSLSVPGGLLNSPQLSGLLPGVTDIGIAAKLAGTPTFSLGADIDITLPLEFDLKNALLGDACSIGTQANPVVLHLTTGTTTPPAGVAPISGDVGQIGTAPTGTNVIEFADQRLVDNAFSVPEAANCGLLGVFNGAANAKAALPSPAGKNLATLVMNTYVASAGDVTGSAS